LSPQPSAPGAPRTFAGDPNPPPQAPEPPKVSSAPAPSPTSGGTGALPPEAAAGAPGRPVEQSDKSFTVVEGPDGSRGVFQWDKNGPTRLGDVSVDDADQVLHALARYDQASKTWSGLPEQAAQHLMEGRLPLPAYLSTKFGEGNSLRGIIGLKFLNGEFSDTEARERGNAELLKAQLKEAPIFAWQGGMAPTVAKMWDDARKAGAAGTARRAAGEVAQAAPDLLRMGGEAALDAGALGLGVAAAGASAPVVLGAGAVGAAYGVFKHVFDVSSGNAALDMLDKGIRPETARVVAPLVGAISGALAVPKIDVMTASAQRALLEKAVASDTFTKVIGRYMADVAKGVSLNAGQEAARVALTDMAAQLDERPQAMEPHPISSVINAAVTSAPVMGLLGLPGAVGEMTRLKAPEEGAELPSQERPGTASPAPGLGTPTSESDGAPVEPTGGESQTPPASSGEGSPLRPGQEVKAPSEESVPEKAAPVKAYDEVLKYRQFEGEKTPDQTVARMKGEAAGMRELLASGKSPNAKFIENALQRHEADIATLEEGPRLGEKGSEPVKAVSPKPMGEEQGPAPAREFFKDPDYTIKPLENDKATTDEIRQQYLGQRNEQIARGNQLARQFRREVPDLTERQAVTRFIDMGGDLNAIKAAAENEDLPAESRAQYAAALDLSPKAQKWAETLGRFYGEAADVGQGAGVMRQVRENYVNRLYAPEDGKAQDFVKNQASGPLRRSSSHALRRAYETMEIAEMDGRKFATTDAADLASVYNEELARSVHGRAMADAMVDSGLGAWKSPRDVPQGWEQVGTLERNVPIKGKDGGPVVGEDGNQVQAHHAFVAPEGIAKGLAAISEPNYTRFIDSLRGVQKYQGIVKTVDLSYSFFHHLSMVAQLAYAGNVSDMLKVGKIDSFLDAPDFAQREQEFVRHGGVTAITGDNADILRNLARDEGDTFSKIMQAPGVKQMMEQTDRGADFLFGKVARLWKVNTFSKLAADWVADHPQAANAEVTEAMRGFARHVNDRFGGQNWEAMGMTKSNLSLLRIGMLAPDWTVSNLHMLKAAIGEGGTSGKASRAHVLSSLVVGMAATEGLNHILTGHFTDQNKPGHKLEVEIAPDVYVSLLRGGVQDITKLASMVAESGLAGVSRFGQGKLGPFARTGVGLLTNTDYNGRPIVPRKAGPVAGTYDVLKYALSSASPVPLGVSNLLSYAQSEKTPTVTGALATATGVGRYSRAPKRR
jgi:hypothetical protein